MPTRRGAISQRSGKAAFDRRCSTHKQNEAPLFRFFSLRRSLPGGCLHSFWQVVHTDVFRRAIPWSKLLLSQRSLPNDLNLRMENRISAIVVWLLALLLLFAIATPLLFIAALLPVAILIVCNRGPLSPISPATRAYLFVRLDLTALAALSLYEQPLSASSRWS
jgi:hypothetical protein